MKSFLQSAEWGKFQASVGRKTFRVGNKLIIKHDLPLGLSYLYCPRIDFKDTQEFKKFTHEIKKIANVENAVFAKIEPNLIKNFDIKNLLKIKNYKLKISNNLQPQDTLLLDLNQSENKILAQMHPKTRYNIRLAEKHRIKIIHSTNVKDIETFYQLAIKTSERDKFSYHSKQYYQKMMETLGKNKMVELLIAEIPNHKSQITNKIQNPNAKYNIQDTKYISIASILVLFYKDTAIYLHGASDYQYRKFMAPYLLQWKAICEARKRGCKQYNFWGICPPAAGISNSPIRRALLESVFETLRGPQTLEWERPRSRRQGRQLPISNEIKNSNVQKEYQCEEFHPWEGITRFKMGFSPNGQIVHYPSTYDLIFQGFWYKIYKLAKH